MCVKRCEHQANIDTLFTLGENFLACDFHSLSVSRNDFPPGKDSFNISLKTFSKCLTGKS